MGYVSVLNDNGPLMFNLPRDWTWLSRGLDRPAVKTKIARD